METVGNDLRKEIATLVVRGDLSSGRKAGKVCVVEASDNQKTDQDLLQEIREGSTESFTTLQTRYKKMVYAVVVRRARGSLQESDWFDVAQLVWIKIWLWIKNVRDPTEYNFGAYLRVCTVNETITALRKQNRTRRLGHESFDDHALTLNSDSCADPTIGDEFVEHMLSGLQSRIRTIVQSYCLDGLTLEEISVLPNVKLSVSYVWKLLQQGIAQIREKYRKDDSLQ